LGIHPFYSPLPKAQNRKSYFARFYKKEDQKEKNNKDEKKLHRLTSCIWFQKFAQIYFKECKFLSPKFLPSLSFYITLRKEGKNFRYN